MDDRRFDALTRAMAQGVSRRLALKGLLGSLVGGAAVATRLDPAGAQACQNDSDCPYEACASWACVESQCFRFFGCYEGQTCCDRSETCIDPGQCCDDFDCNAGDCETCSGQNICVSSCATGESCCLGTCIDPATQCCDLGDCDTDKCETCADATHTCVSYCRSGTICCGTACSVCCQDSDCPVNQFCCDGSGDAYCAFCCADDQCDGPLDYCDEGHCYTGECHVDADCPECSTCNGHTCFQIACLEGYACCGGDECVPEDDCCKREGQTCGEIVPTADDGPGQYDCCDGLLCCFGQATNICAECCSDDDCDAGGTCDDWVCVYPSGCDHDRDCPHGTCCCHDGSCSRKCCPHPHPKPSDGGTVTTLPATGAGQERGASGLLGAAALGAAVLFAAKTVRNQQPAELGEAPTEE